MPTESMFDSEHDHCQFQARLQLGVGDEYNLVKLIRAVPVNLEDTIDQIDARSGELDGEQKWDELMEASKKAPLAWLPSGWLLVTMRHRDSPKEQVDATGFIYILASSQETTIYHSTGSGKTQAADEMTRPK